MANIGYARVSSRNLYLDLYLNYENIELCRRYRQKEIGAIGTVPQNEDYEYFRITDKIFDIVDSLPKLKFENK